MDNFERKRRRASPSGSPQALHTKGDDTEKEEVCAICFQSGERDDDDGGNGILLVCGDCGAACHPRCLHVWSSECLAATAAKDEAALFCPCCRRSAVEPANKGEARRREEEVHSKHRGKREDSAEVVQNQPFINFRSNNNLATRTGTGGGSSSSSSSNGNNDWGLCDQTLWGDLEYGGPTSDIPLSQKEAISQKNWPLASAWKQVLGRDLATCLLSRDWQVREGALRCLAREAANALRHAAASASPETFPERFWRSTAEVLTRALNDKVLKVYLSAARCLRTLLVFTQVRHLCAEQIQIVRASARPILQELLARCADNNKRVAEASWRVLVELCRGSSGHLALGGAYQDRDEGEGDLLGLDFVLQVMLEERDSRMQGSTLWQATLGRLILLEKLLSVLGTQFRIRRDHGAEVLRFTAEYRRTMAVAEFSLNHLASIHANASKASCVVFTAAAKMALGHPTAFTRIWDLISNLDDSTLQARMKRKLRVAISKRGNTSGMSEECSGASPEQYMMVDKLFAQDQFSQEDLMSTPSSSACSSPLAARGLQAFPRNNRKSSSQWRLHHHQQLNRSISHSPSRHCLLDARSASQSPARALTKSQSGNLRSPPPRLKRPNYLPLKATARPRQPSWRQSPPPRLEEEYVQYHTRHHQEEQQSFHQEQLMDLDRQRQLLISSPPPVLPPRSESPLPLVPSLFAAYWKQFEQGVHDEVPWSSSSPSSPSRTATNSPTGDSPSPATFLAQSQWNRVSQCPKLKVHCFFNSHVQLF